MRDGWGPRLEVVALERALGPAPPSLPASAEGIFQRR